jgi:hypothetical protein
MRRAVVLAVLALVLSAHSATACLPTFAIVQRTDVTTCGSYDGVHWECVRIITYYGAWVCDGQTESGWWGGGPVYGFPYPVGEPYPPTSEPQPQPNPTDPGTPTTCSYEACEVQAWSEYNVCMFPVEQTWSGVCGVLCQEGCRTSRDIALAQCIELCNPT